MKSETTMKPVAVSSLWSGSTPWSLAWAWVGLSVVTVLFGWRGEQLLWSVPALLVVSGLLTLRKVEVYADRVILRRPWGAKTYPIEALRGVSVAAASWSNHDPNASTIHLTARWEGRWPLRLRGIPLREARPLIELLNGALVTAYERRVAQGEAVIVPLDRCHVPGTGHFAAVSLATEGFRLLTRTEAASQTTLKAAPFRAARGEAEGYIAYRAILGWFDRGSHWALHLRNPHVDWTITLAGGETTVLLTLLARRLHTPVVIPLEG